MKARFVATVSLGNPLLLTRGADTARISDALYCGAGCGPFATQQDVPDAAATRRLVPIMFMRSQQCLPVEHSVRFENERAHAEAGIACRPIKLNVKTETRILRIRMKYTPFLLKYTPFLL